MIDARNCGNLTAGIVVPPETITMNGGKIVKLRVAVPYAGNEKGTEDNRGFFDVTYYAREAEPNAKFVLGQIEAGNFKPGTTIQMLYRLQQDRWETPDGKKGNKVVLVAESIAYAGNNNNASKEETTVASEVSLPDKF